MSRTIDERVVQMKFDNKEFEQNIQTSMSSIQKLNSSLNFDSASKGFDSITTAAKNVNISGITSAVETLHSKFSALEVMGVTALANITNSAINAGKRIVSELTVDPIKQGFSEYELKMDSVKTIVASTGEELSVVNDYLEELNKYSDQTIYSFSDMTQNIGKFTNAGVKLEDAVLAIKGISNEAAVSGANAQEASRAMYNFAQALSAGYVKLIDWKSIENANMATVEFKEQLLETALACGTVVQTADGMYKSITTDANGRVSDAFNATQMFNDSLSAQWMTTEVLTETLKKYADESTEIGKKAFAAAQDVTKLSQVFDILKETAQSGWAKTWEIIFGDLDQAKALFTPITNFLSGIIEGMSNFRNNLLEGALSNNPFTALLDKLNNSGLGKIKEYSDGISKLSDDIAYYQDIVDKVWHGDYKNADTGRFELLDADGYDHRVVQDLVNKGLGYQLTLEDITASQEKFGLTVSSTNDEVKDLSSVLEDLTDEKLKDAGFTDEEIKLYRELAKEAKAAGIPLNELIDNMSKKDGRTLLIESLTNIGKSLVNVFGAIKNAWVQVFPPMSSVTLYNIIAGFHKLTECLKISEDTAGKLQRVFAGFFSIFGIGLDIIKAVLSVGFTLIKTLLGPLGTVIKPASSSLLDLAANLGDVIVAFREGVSFVDIFKNAISKMQEYAIVGIGVMKNFGSTILDTLSPLSTYVTIAIEAVKNFGSQMVSAIAGSETISKFVSVGKNMMAGIIEGFKEKAGEVLTAIIDVAKSLYEGFKEFFGIHSPSLLFMSLGAFIIAGLVAGLSDTSSLSKAIQGIFDIIQVVIDGAISVISSIAKSIAPVVSTLGSLLKDVFSALVEALSSGGLSSILDIFTTGAFTAAGFSIAGFVKSLTSITDNIGKPFEKIPDILNSVKGCLEAYQNAINAEALMNIAKAVAVLVISLLALSFINSEKLSQGLIGLGAVLAEISVFIKKSGLTTLGPKAATSILTLSFALLILSGALFLMGIMSGDTIITGLLAMAGVLVVLSKAVNSLPDGKGLIKTSIAIAIISGAMITLAAAIFLMGHMSFETIGKGLLAIGGALAILVIAINNIKGDKLIKSGIAIAIISGAMITLAAAMFLMGSMSLETIGKGLLAMAGSLAAIVIAMNLINDKGILSKTAALIGVSVALIILSGALAIMGSMSLETIGKGLLALGGSLAILVIALNLMTNTLPGSAALLVAAAALAILAPVLLALGVSAPIAAIGLAVVAGAFVLLGVAGLLLAPLTPVILALSGAIALLGIGMGSFGVGVLALATGLATLAVIGTPAAVALELIFTTILGMIPYALTMLGEGILAFCNVITNGAPAIGEAVTAIVLTIVGVITDCLPEVANCIGLILGEILALVVEVSPGIAAAFLELLLSGLKMIRDNIGEVTIVALEIVTAFLLAVADQIDDVVAAAVDVVVAFIEGIGQGTADIVTAAVELVITVANSIVENVCKIVDAAFELIINFINGLAKAIDDNYEDLFDAVENLIDTICKVIVELLPRIVEKGVDIIASLLKGFASMYSKAKEKAGELVKKCAEAMTKKVSSFKSAAKDLINGFIKGIGEKIKDAKKAISEFCDGVVEKAKNILGIKSPSRVFMTIGKFLTEGFCIGLSRTAGQAASAAGDMANDVIDGFSSPLSRLADVIGGEIDVNPTIRPVLDLSDVEAGSGLIGNMLANRTLAVDTVAAGSVSAAMTRIQNGLNNNADIVSAIKGLRKDISNMSNTTNIIDGITYDDGSGISSAVEEIFRFARLEGRV